MRRTLFLPIALPRPLSRRAIQRPSQPFTKTTPTIRHSTSSSSFTSGPAPPRLPKDEQELFERLQRQSSGAFSTPRPASDSKSNTAAADADLDVDTNARIQLNQSQSPASNSSPSPSSSADTRAQINQSPDSEEGGDNGGFHPNMRRGAPPEFEGEVNPKTGEVGGPKNEPLRWGGQGDYSYNGRVTDF